MSSSCHPVAFNACSGAFPLPAVYAPAWCTLGVANSFILSQTPLEKIKTFIHLPAAMQVGQLEESSWFQAPGNPSTEMEVLCSSTDGNSPSPGNEAKVLQQPPLTLHRAHS